ncbi:MAG TPA: M20/M25/M40 family metallo-hydrolase [Bryobacteraceae bacterium]|nr:M20/M25/M40 family metallo-hydrolase [Bryobacteraceae bacterium]
MNTTILTAAAVLALLQPAFAQRTATLPKTAAVQKAAASKPAADEKRLIGAVTADSMRGDVSFLASDLLEGRDTPSRGLEIAAEYLASQFRAMGLKPAAGNDYFQAADFVLAQPSAAGLTLTLESASEKFEVNTDRVMFTSDRASEGSALDVVAIDMAGEPPARAAVEGKVVLIKPAGRISPARRDELRAMGAALVISFTPFLSRRAQLRESGEGPGALSPSVAIQDAELQQKLGAAGPLKASFKIPAQTAEKLKLKNVVAVLEGSDPSLKKSYVLLSGHYDHNGVNPRGDGDRINNGANDDASGTSTVLEIARAFQRTGLKPKRSIIFALWFGEEKGLFGSRYYASHPIFPLKDTVAMINFEHMGRTDDNEGSTKGRMSLTGFDYTDIGETLAGAGKVAGIGVYKHEKNSDQFFAASDNQPFAEAGVPAHAALSCFIFPDYHRPGDEWQKIDYDNMAQLTRVAAVTAWRIANNPKPPAWNQSNAKTASYVKAAQALQGVK